MCGYIYYIIRYNLTCKSIPWACTYIWPRSEMGWVQEPPNLKNWQKLRFMAAFRCFSPLPLSFSIPPFPSSRPSLYVPFPSLPCPFHPPLPFSFLPLPFSFPSFSLFPFLLSHFTYLPFPVLSHASPSLPSLPLSPFQPFQQSSRGRG